MGLPCHWPRRARHSRVGGRGTALDRGRHPETTGKGAPNWGTRERDILDVRCETPERQRDLAGSVELRDRSEPGGRREGRWRRKRHPGPGTRPEGTRTGLVMSHVVAANGKAPITALGKTATHRLSQVASNATAHRECCGVASGFPGTTADRCADSLQRPLNPRPVLVSGRQRSCSPRARPKRRSISLLNWNVGLDYTARRPNCQSANAFVDPRQTRAPRLRNAPSKTDPRFPSQPLASRANSRPRSAPSTIA